MLGLLQRGAIEFRGGIVADLGGIRETNRCQGAPDIGLHIILRHPLTELCLSPMGISFVSKVAPPKYKGAMMGMWFVATAAGNYLVSVIGLLWGGMQLWMVWSVLIVLCLISAIFIFSIMRKLEQATK